MDYEFYSDEANLESLGAESGDEIKTEVTQDQGESTSENADDSNNNDEGEKSLEDQLNSLEVEENEEGGENGLLGLVNGLGITRNGLPQEFDNEDKIKEYLSKGLDYTLKTQEHADSVKAQTEEFESQKASFETERQEFDTKVEGLQTGINEHKVMTQILSSIAQSDPEYFAELDAMYVQQMSQLDSQMNNPMVKQLNGQMDEMRKQMDDIRGQDAEKENDSIKEGWETGLKEMQTSWGPKLKSLGIKPDWTKVQDIWASDSKGEMSHKAALLAVHGEKITEAMESKSKLIQTKAKSNQRLGQTSESENETADSKKEFDSESSAHRMARLQKIADKYAS